jgi:hypothetical protein
MPNYNLFYNGERLFPVLSNDSEICFRIWFNNSSSIERVITISYDSISGYQGILIEYGDLYKKRLVRKGYRKNKSVFKEIKITPKNGFENFIKSIDSLKIMTREKQIEFSIVPHEPFSFYVVEYKNNKDYNQFIFTTDFPIHYKENTSEYEDIQNLVFKEFKQYIIRR